MTSTWASHHFSPVSVCQLLLLWEMSLVWVPTSYIVVNEFRQNPLDRWRSCTEINNSIPLLKFSIWWWCGSDPLLTVDYVSWDDGCYDWLICCRYLFVLRFPIESLIFVLNVRSNAYVAGVWCTRVELFSDKLSENFRFDELGRIYYNITCIML